MIFIVFQKIQVSSKSQNKLPVTLASLITELIHLKVIMSKNIIHLSDATFETEVLQSTVPVLVDYWAEWCGPCKMIAPILEQVAAENEGKIVIAKLNVDENPKTAQALGITSIPTMNIYKGGQIVKTIVGAKPKPALLADLAAFL